ncbi:MAG: hypothetical protein ACTSRI_05810 [Promethearchaeota archaeon]
MKKIQNILDYFEEKLIQRIYNFNEFKEWLLSRRWFGDKSALSNLEFKVNLSYCKILSKRIILTIIDIKTPEYTKAYFLPLIYYNKIQEILEPSEKEKDNIVKLTKNTFSKKLIIEGKQKIFTLNFLEAEYCLFFWKSILFDKEVLKSFPSLSIDFTLYKKQFEDELNAKKVQILLEVGLFPEKYLLSLNQLGGGNTTNILFMLNVSNVKTPNQEPVSYVLKSYKGYSENLEPSTLFVLVKNKFLNAPKIYGTIKIRENEIIGIIESVPNTGNIGDIFWNELQSLVEDIDINTDYSELSKEIETSKLIEKNCIETLKISEEIGKYIKSLHESLILSKEKRYSLETIKSDTYLKNYTDKLNLMISGIKSRISQQLKITFFNLQEINSILMNTKKNVERFRAEFDEPQIKIQPIHQDLHMEQILYNKSNDNYNFYFIDFEGDPQLSIEERKGKFPFEKDLASFLRSLSYIKFNTLLGFLEKKFVKKDKSQKSIEFLYNIFFQKVSNITNETMEAVFNLLNAWEMKLTAKILQNIGTNKILVYFFTIERVLSEINYEILYRPNNIIFPILGLKEIIEKN